MKPRTPLIVLIYGLFGVIPFLAPAISGMIFPETRTIAAHVLILYGGLILSFLGGARWAFANTDQPPNPALISASMAPSLVALGVFILPSQRIQIWGLAAALGLHWLWDIRSRNLPGWYPTLRTQLTVGAVAGLIAGTITLT